MEVGLLTFDADGSLTLINLQNNLTIRFSLAQTRHDPPLVRAQRMFSDIHKRQKTTPPMWVISEDEVTANNKPPLNGEISTKTHHSCNLDNLTGLF